MDHIVIIGAATLTVASIFYGWLKGHTDGYKKGYREGKLETKPFRTSMFNEAAVQINKDNEVCDGRR